MEKHMKEFGKTESKKEKVFISQLDQQSRAFGKKVSSSIKEND